MKQMFIAADGSVRNGWKVAAYMLGTVLIGALAWLVVYLLPKSLRAYLQFNWLMPLVIGLGTYAALKLDRMTLADIGLRFNRRFFMQVLAGIAVGVGMMGLLIAALWLTAGFDIHLAANASMLGALSLGLTFVVVALCEEVYFRGYALQRSMRGLGAHIGNLTLAVVFACAHLGNPGMSGLTMVIAVVNIVLAGVMLGYFYLQTRSLAVSLGFHLAWNWTQESMGFATSGNTPQGTFSTVLHEAPAWLTGGAFGPESSLLCTALLSAVVLWQFMSLSSQDASRLVSPAPALATH